MANVSGKYSGISLQPLIGAFMSTYEGGLTQGFATKIGGMHNVSGDTFKLIGLGNAPGLRPWKGNRETHSLNQYKTDVVNQEYQAGIDIPIKSLTRDGVGAFAKKIKGMANKAVFHWDELAVDLINSTATNTKDGQKFFDTDHAVMNSGTQTNNVSATEVGALNLTLAAPTASEMAAVMLGLAAYMATFKDEHGDPINGAARQFVFVVNSSINYQAALAALTQDTYANGESNLLRNSGYKFEVVYEPRITTANVVQLFRVDTEDKAIVLNEEVLEFDEISDPEDSYVVKNKAAFFGVFSIRAAAYGNWESAIQGTLS